MSTPSFTERLRYWFDGVMAKGTGALVGLLGIVTLVFITIVAAIVTLFGIFPTLVDGDENPDFFEVLWGNLMRAMDAGTIGGDQGWPFRAAMLVVTIGGIFLVASLIGIIASAFDSKVDELRKGRSRVLETDHTLILGWSSKVFPIIAELVIANESRRRSTIVVLAEGDKVAMEDDIRAQVPNSGRTKIIVRSGTPMDLTDLEVANPHQARSIVILAPEDSDDPDSVVIKTTLALTNNPNRRSDEYHIVGEIQDPANLEAARLVGRNEADWVLSSDLISRITVQTCRQSGLSGVYTELLDFAGDEIYFTDQPSLVGSSYLHAQHAFNHSAVIGLVQDGAVHINPAAATVLGEGDQLIVIAEDDSTIKLATPGVVDASSISTKRTPKLLPEQTLVIGYNSGLTTILSELNDYVAKGSKVTVVADVERPAFASYSNMTVEFVRGDSTSRAVLDSVPVKDFEHIIVLAYKDTLDMQRADAKTLVTLLHLREIADAAGVDPNVVSEMLDDRNRQLAEVTKADDFIVSDKLISLMLSQLSENRQLNEVFDVLFSSEGSEIYLRPAELYVKPGVSVDFYTVLEAASRRGETAIGYRVKADANDADSAYGIRVNPRKHAPVTFGPGDKLIVLADS